jgi:hypothetical protein
LFILLGVNNPLHVRLLGIVTLPDVSIVWAVVLLVAVIEEHETDPATRETPVIVPLLVTFPLRVLVPVFVRVLQYTVFSKLELVTPRVPIVTEDENSPDVPVIFALRFVVPPIVTFPLKDADEPLTDPVDTEPEETLPVTANEESDRT